MKIGTTFVAVALVGGLFVTAPMQAAANRITASVDSLDVMHHGKKVTISRAQGDKIKIPEAYAKTSRVCPPFCIQPMTVVPGVDTVGELEVLGYLKRIAGGDKSLLVVDSRTPDWIVRGTIPGSVNVPWNKINVDVGGTFELEAEAETLAGILTDVFGAKPSAGGWDFSEAKTLVMFCNGAWCPQSSINIKTLTKLGYPTHKIKWYRGGMQDWVSLGLTTVAE